MKVELKEVENKGFKPFKIELTIETLEELKDLQARFQLVRCSVNDNYTYKRWMDDEVNELSREIGKQFDKY